MPVNVYNEMALPLDMIEVLENKYQCRYICDTQLRYNGKWHPHRIALFYKDEPFNESSSNWIGFTFDLSGDAIVIDAVESVDPDPTINAVYTPKGYMYSVYQHDVQCYAEDEHEVCVEGGREYLEVKGSPKIVKLIITPEGLEVLQ